MKLLLDECTPKRLKNEFAGHETFTVDDAGLKGLENGQLLDAASGRFDVIVTVDRNIPFQQKIQEFKLAIVILVAPSNRYEDLRLLVPKALEELKTIQPGQLVLIK